MFMADTMVYNSYHANQQLPEELDNLVMQSVKIENFNPQAWHITYD